jgi:hypothetical protein
MLDALQYLDPARGLRTRWCCGIWLPDFRHQGRTNMRTHRRIATLLCVGVFAVAATASGDGSRGRQWAAVYLDQATLVGATIVQGPVVFIHDDAKMARGEPCTSVRLLEPGAGPGEEIAAFHCIPVRRAVVSRFTLRTRPNTELGFGCVLTEYQFAGDSEGHGVPYSTNAH